MKFTYIFKPPLQSHTTYKATPLLKRLSKNKQASLMGHHLYEISQTKVYQAHLNYVTDIIGTSYFKSSKQSFRIISKTFGNIRTMNDSLRALVKSACATLSIVVPIFSFHAVHAKHHDSTIISENGDAITVFGKPYNLKQYRTVNGIFTLTAYNLDRQSTGKSPGDPGYGVTASGTRASIGRTVAVDPKVIPYGSLLYIEGIGWRIAEDTGGAIQGHHIDVLVNNRRKAVHFGVMRHHPVEIFVQSEPTRNLPVDYAVTASGNPRRLP